MGEVINLAKYRKQRQFPRPRRRKRKGSWKFKDLAGKRPHKHPALVRGRGGRVLLAKNQVWVERSNDKLWVIQDLQKVRKSFYAYDVILVAYKGKEVRIICEANVRQTMEVWDESAEFNSSLVQQLRQAMKKYRLGPLSRGHDDAPEQILAFLGLDEDGSRTED